MSKPASCARHPTGNMADQQSMLREHGKKFNDGRYELFKSSMKYDGEIGRQQHEFPTIEKRPA